MGEVTAMKEKKDEGYEKWDIENAWRTIKDAEKYKNDKKMMGLVKAEAVKEVQAVKEANNAIQLEQKVGAKLADIGKKMAEDN